MLRMNGKAIIAGVAVAGGLATLTLMPVTTQADDGKKAPPRCVNGPGIDTTVLDEETVLAEGAGRGGVLIKVDGCRLTPYDILVFEYRGSVQICDPIDVQLSVRANGMGHFKTPCFVQSVTPVSAEEAKGLRKQEYKRTDR
ncbi:hypothetical protein [Asticcacaulis sp. AND118]|uniref:hypothetical protein n=1 Tax=Asticcacaulis sp. AND118 TaxID=2840468 RepID=UPI001CFFC323|nr:hypothetical protein [Asticcacaulis sp. AND118]UDF04965.1 hypothetical protein LH365_16340 [Asticcacaulis sp. AND118]